MKRTSSHAGSALLIVLGMLSFMIISAVGFATYMRYSRQPSSDLRRNSSARQLTKAALAEAMNIVDLAVNNNPHPGVGTLMSGSSTVRNGWQHRVFTGTNVTLTASTGTTASASPLCLEALAYIPPPLVNEARYYSRFVPSAQWQTLDFDAGRFTWLALDVSDYFDINRLLANTPRASAPNRRISLAYLFENLKHTAQENNPEQWDKFMETYRGSPDETTGLFDLKSREPLISLGDFSLALGYKGSAGGFTSPFYDFLNGSGSQAGFYGTESEKDEEKFRRMTFVTDSLTPSSSGTSKTDKGDTLYDLNDGDYQPFDISRLDQEGTTSIAAFVPSVDSTMQHASDWVNRLSAIGCAILFDYLDTDHYPVSLAIPTTERVPMICGIRPVFEGASFSVTKTLDPEGDEADKVKVVSGDEHTRHVQKKVVYRIESGKLAPGFAGEVTTVVAFPFLHARDNDSDDGKGFSVDGRFSLFMSTEEMGLRTGEMNDVLHLSSQSIETGLNADAGVINVKLNEQSLSAFTSVKQASDAVRSVSGLKMTEGIQTCAQLSQDGHELLTVTYEWDQTQENVGGVYTSNWTPGWGATIWEHPDQYATEAKCNVKAVKANGVADTDLKDALALVKGGYDNGKDIWLNASAVMRVKKNNRIVDMAPACVFDDKIQNSANLGPLSMGGGGSVAAEIGGLHYPMLRFDTGVKFRLSLKGLNEISEQEIKLTANSASDTSTILVADPRWNHAPEHWFAYNGDLNVQTWLDNNKVADSGRDKDDIFLATSDAGYLQSVYELAMLPRLTDLETYGNSKVFGNMDGLKNANKTSIPGSFGDTMNSGFAWREYDPFSDSGRTAFENFPRTSAGNGYKINPYSDSTNILMAAFANTPVDWNRASTNIVEGEEYDSGTTAKDFNQKKAFNEYTSGTKIAWGDLEAIAGRFMDLTRSKSSWEDAWQDLDWDYDADKLCGVDLSDNTDDLWTVDRKFLYGFWRDCFAAKQQLFLIFVRAEPMMMGSEGNGQVPPQLGARAMALVWRDPAKAEDTKMPHQMRVLFYRQFE